MSEVHPRETLSCVIESETLRYNTSSYIYDKSPVVLTSNINKGDNQRQWNDTRHTNHPEMKISVYIY